jgi:hypothetical protein
MLSVNRFLSYPTTKFLPGELTPLPKFIRLRVFWTLRVLELVFWVFSLFLSLGLL